MDSGIQYRAAWPAYSIFSMDKSSELLDGLVQHHKDTDWVPRWSAPGEHTLCQVQAVILFLLMQ